MAEHFHSVFGLTLASELPLPELPVALVGAPVDVTICAGRAEKPGEWGMELRGDGRSAFFEMPGIGRYVVSHGSHILVDAAEGAAARNVRLYLLGSAFGVLLHQRGLFPLHANAVEVNGRAVAFVGPSGAGKSTLAAWFHDHGWPLFADDVCVLQVGDRGQLVAHPGIPRLRLWREALEKSGRQTDQFQCSWDGDDTYQKYDVPVASSARALAPRPLAAVYDLGVSQGSGVDIQPLHGALAFKSVFDNTYRRTFLNVTGDKEAYWQSCLKIVRAVPIFSVSREWGWYQFDAQAELIAAHLSANSAP